MLRSTVIWIVLVGVAVTTFAMLPLRAQDEAKPEAKPDEAKVSEILRFLPEGEPDNESLVHDALDRYVSLEFEHLPLNAAAAAIAKKCGISVVINGVALEDEKVAIDAPISLNVSRVTLRSALKRMLEPLQLRAIVQDGVLLITTSAEAVNQRKLVVYDVTDLQQRRRKEPGTANLVQLVLDNTGGEPDGPWLDVDGEGGTMSLMALGDADLLVVRTTEVVHREIEQLFEDLRELQEEEDEDGPTIATSAAMIEQRLKRRVSVNFEDVNWQAAVQTLATGIGVPVQIDPVIGEDPQVTFRAENTQASIVLERLLKPRHLTWQVRDSGLRIARPETLDQELDVQVYDVREYFGVRPDPKAFDFKPLIEFVQSLEGDPKTDEKPAMTIAGTEMQGLPMLVVKTSHERQVRIAKLFEQMRAARRRFAPDRAVNTSWPPTGMGGSGK